MSSTIALISSIDINEIDFVAFLQKVDAIIDNVDTGKGRMLKGNAFFEIFMSTKRELEHYSEEDHLQLLRNKLGDVPRAMVILEVPDSLESEQQAIEFACQFAKVWPCVVDDSPYAIYSMEELEQLRQVGQGFPLHRDEDTSPILPAQ